MNRIHLIEQIRRKESFLCVGLDPDVNKIPEFLLKEKYPLFEFCKAVADATADYAVAFKPNLAFFESEGASGWISFEKTVGYIKEKYPDILIIADAKRGDIGNTAAMYARSFFKHTGVDALTVAPYMGSDSVKPFLEYDGKWVVLLALTSNEGAGDFQYFGNGQGERLFEKVISVSKEWAGPDKMMYVVGATRADMLEDIRRLIPDSFLLVPGVGAQGGSLAAVCKYGMNRDCGLLVNSSRGIIYASKGPDFADAAAAKAREMALQMKMLMKEHGII